MQRDEKGSKGIMHKVNLSQSKVILLRDVPVSAQTRMSNWYAAGFPLLDINGSAGYVKEQYKTNKALLDAVSSMVVGMNSSRSCMEKNFWP